MTRLYILLGRAGDIISLLPLLWADHKAGIKSGLMVAKEFAGILDGVSYLEPVIFDGHMNEIDRAVDEASKMCEDVRIAQLAGPREGILKQAYEKIGLHVGDAQHSSFEREAWRLAQRDDEWRHQHPLVFDRRDKAREEALFDAVFYDQRPVVLVALDGQSSPFPFKKLLLSLLRNKFAAEDTFRIFDLSTIKAERIYDLLGVMEMATCLIACDSAILHLANACPKLPVVALIQDKPSLFFGSAWRANHLTYMRYGDFPDRFSDIQVDIDNLSAPGSKFNAALKKPCLVHVWSAYDTREDNRTRQWAAESTWGDAEGSNRWVDCCFEIGASGRDSVTVFKDIYRVPYLKDVIRHGIMLAQDGDTIVLTRCDTCFQPDLHKQLLALKTPGYAFRQSEDGTWQTQVPDLFCFTREFFREHHAELPDLLMGADPYWPMVLMEFLKLHGAVGIPNAIYREKGQPFKVTRSAYREQNEKLAKAFLEKHGLLKIIPRVIDQASVTLVKSEKLFPFAYNPSLIRHNGKLLMAYRAHENMDKASSLAIAELDADLNVLSNQWIHKANTISSQEDARLFSPNGNLWFSHVESDIRAQTCVMWYGQLSGGYAPMSGFKPLYGANDGTGLEKNWLFFEHHGNPFCIYSSFPEQQVVSFEREFVREGWNSKSPSWPYGEIRGGCLIPWKDKFLRFFHSRLENEVNSVYWRYYVGCLVMDSKPPFAVEKVCSAPILKGSELDSLTPDERAQCSHWKPNVAIPYGVVADGDGWLLSVGINDSACGIVRLTEKELNL